MAKTTDVLQSAIQHWQRDAASNAKDQGALRSSMRALAANIDASHPSHLSGFEKLRLHGKLEQMAHAVDLPRQKHYEQVQPVAASVSTFA